MAVTVAPTNLTTFTGAQYRAQNPTVTLTHVGLVSTPPGSTATPSATAGGFFDVWFDLVNNKLIIDTTSTMA
jgi:hypothetical protein